MTIDLPFPLSALVFPEDVVLREYQKFAKCPRCGAWVDCEDAAQVARHLQPHTKPFLGELVILGRPPPQ